MHVYMNKDQYTKSSFHMLMQAPVTPATHMRSKKDCTCTSSVSIATRCEQCLYAWQNKYWLHLIVSRVMLFPVQRTSAHAIMSHVTNHAAWAHHHLSGPCMPCYKVESTSTSAHAGVLLPSPCKICRRILHLHLNIGHASTGSFHGCRKAHVAVLVLCMQMPDDNFVDLFIGFLKQVSVHDFNLRPTRCRNDMYA